MQEKKREREEARAAARAIVVQRKKTKDDAKAQAVREKTNMIEAVSGIKKGLKGRRTENMLHS